MWAYLIRLRKQHINHKKINLISTVDKRLKWKNATAPSDAMMQCLPMAEELQDGMLLDEVQEKEFCNVIMRNLNPIFIVGTVSQCQEMKRWETWPAINTELTQLTENLKQYVTSLMLSLLGTSRKEAREDEQSDDHSRGNHRGKDRKRFRTR